MIILASSFQGIDLGFLLLESLTCYGSLSRDRDPRVQDFSQHGSWRYRDYKIGNPFLYHYTVTLVTSVPLYQSTSAHSFPFWGGT